MPSMCLGPRNMGIQPCNDMINRFVRRSHLGYDGGKQGRGPDKGQSPVKWGEFPSVCTSIHPSVLRPSQPGLKPQA